MFTVHAHVMYENCCACFFWGDCLSCLMPGLCCFKVQHETFIRGSIFDLQPVMGIDFSLHISKLRPLLFNFAVGYVIRKVQANHKELEWEGTHQVPVHINDFNLLGESEHRTKRNKGALLVISNELGLELITVHLSVFKSCARNNGLNHNINVAIKLFVVKYGIIQVFWNYTNKN
jgi:hypothetical protein